MASDYVAEKVADLLEVARIAADMMLGSWPCGAPDDHRTSVLAKDLDALKAAVDRAIPAWFDDLTEDRDPSERLRLAMEREGFATPIRSNPGQARGRDGTDRPEALAKSEASSSVAGGAKGDDSRGE